QEEVPHGRFEIADIEHYQVPQNIDVVFAFASLLHLPKESFAAVLATLYENLARGGIVFISLKNAPYAEAPITDEFGTRTFYWYTPELVKELAAGYELVWQNEHYIKTQNWLEVILRKN